MSRERPVIGGRSIFGRGEQEAALGQLTRHQITYCESKLAQYHETGQLSYLEEAIRISGALILMTTDPVPEPSLMMILSRSLLASYMARRVDAELQHAIWAAEVAVTATPEGSPNLTSYIRHLADALNQLYIPTGPSDYLEPGWKPALIAERFFTIYNRHGVVELLQEAIRLAQVAVAATPEGHRKRAAMLDSLGGLLYTRFERFGELEDLQEAILREEAAVAATPAGNPERALVLTNLGVQLSARFDRTGALEDIQEAIRRSEEAVAATPEDHPDRAGMLSNLGTRLSTRFNRTGVLEDLEESIRRTEEAAVAIPVGHLFRARILNNLGNRLSALFDRTGALDALQEGIRRSEEAVAATPVGHPDRAKWLGSLGCHLSARSDRAGALEDLDEAIRRSEEAVAATPVGSPDRADRLTSLGCHLSARFNRTGVLEDLYEAIRRSEEAVAVTPAGHPRCALFLSNLGSHLVTRFYQTGALGDLQEGIRRSEEAVAATPVDDPRYARMLHNLGICLSTRFDRSGDVEDCKRACTAWEMSANSSIGHPVLCVRSARLAAKVQIKLGHLQAAYSNSRSAIKLLHQASSRAIEREDQEYILGQVSGTSSLAASLALETGEPASTALELLEFGCGIIAGYTFDARNDVSELGERYPALCSRYKALQDELSLPLQVPKLECYGIPSMAPTGNRVTRRLEAIRELDELEAEIRRKDGFSRFQLPPLSVDFITLARSIGGPIVAFSVSSLRGDAILVTHKEIKALPLPGLDYDTLREKSGLLSNDVKKGPRGTLPDRLDSLKGVLLWLWKVAVEPVLQELNFHQDVPIHQGEPLPRIWWISSGPMGMMPIHAAGDYASYPKIIASNYVISSYTPTIKSLAYARRKSSQVRGPGNDVLIIGNSFGTSRSPGFLSEVQEETEAIERIVQGTVGAACTIPDPPFKKTVLDNLTTCNIAHFACHGVTDPRDPCNSHLLLPGLGGTDTDPLRIKDLSNRNLDRSMLAYLSACHSANYTSKNKNLLDEAIHIASGFQLAGFPHVIGTLWGANDLMAREIATEFYKNLFGSLNSGRGYDNGIVAEALYKAVASLRKELEDNPILWAPFIHLGA